MEKVGLKSPCLTCDNKDKSKDNCCKTCKRLEEFQKKHCPVHSVQNPDQPLTYSTNDSGWIPPRGGK